jgi:hypothetical protein
VGAAAGTVPSAAVVHQHWSRARSELKRNLAEEAEGEVANLYEPIVVLGGHENQELAASTWPFPPKVVKDLVASLVGPIAMYALKIAIGLWRNT